MKYLLPLISILLLLTFCSPTETVTEPEAPEEEVEESIEPDWYNSRTTSSADSVSFTGYAHATSTDTTEAQEIADKMALVNLRFEIDKFVEETRDELAESTGEDRYNSPEFIIRLRNVTESLDLSGSEFTHHIHATDNGVVHVFSNAKSERRVIIDKLQATIEDDQLTNYQSNL